MKRHQTSRYRDNCTKSIDISSQVIDSIDLSENSALIQTVTTIIPISVFVNIDLSVTVAEAETPTIQTNKYRIQIININHYCRDMQILTR